MTAYEMRISDWRSDVCSSDLLLLLLFYAPDQSQGLLQSHVNGVARHLVGIHRRFHLNPVHRNDAATGVGVDSACIIGLNVKFRPVAELPLQRNAAFGKGI